MGAAPGLPRGNLNKIDLSMEAKGGRAQTQTEEEQ